MKMPDAPKVMTPFAIENRRRIAESNARAHSYIPHGFKFKDMSPPSLMPPAAGIGDSYPGLQPIKTLSAGDFRSENYSSTTKVHAQGDWLTATVPPVIRSINVRRVFRTMIEGGLPLSGFKPFAVFAEILAFDGLIPATMKLLKAITCNEMLFDSAPSTSPPWRTCLVTDKIASPTTLDLAVVKYPQQVLAWAIYLVSQRPAQYLDILGDFVHHFLCDDEFIKWLETRVLAEEHGTMYDLDAILRLILKGWYKNESKKWPTDARWKKEMARYRPMAIAALKNRREFEAAFRSKRIQGGSASTLANMRQLGNESCTE